MSGKYVMDPVQAIWQRRKRLAFTAFAFPLAVAMTATVVLPDVFESTALVLVEVSTRGSRDDSERRVRQLTEQNLSRARLEAAVARHGLYPALGADGVMEEAVKQLRADVRIEHKDAPRGGPSTVALAVTYRGRPAARVAKVAQDFAQFYVDEDCRHRRSEAEQTLARLAAQLEQVQARLIVDQRQVQSFINRYLPELPQQAGANLAALERLSSEITRSRLPEEHAGHGNGRRPSLDLRIDEIRAALADLKGRYTERYPDVIRLKSELTALEQRRDAERAMARSGRGEQAGRDVDPATTDLGNDARRLRRAIEVYEGRVYNAPKRQQELDALMLPYENTKALYQALEARYEEARFEAGLDCTQAAMVRIVDPAAVPRIPVAPDRNRLTLAGLLGSVLTAGMAVLLAEQLDTSFHSREALRAFCRLPLLTSIPRIATAADKARQRMRRASAVAVVLFLLALVVAGTFLYARGNDGLVWMVSRGL